MAAQPNSATLIQRGLLLEYITLGWNVVGSVLVVIAAVNARSVALAGFGLDSVIEIFASLVVVWQLKGIDDHREHIALRMIGIAFFALAAYITCQFVITLITRTHPQPSVVGTIWLAATLVAMLLLSYGKRVTGRRLDNSVLVTESRVTLIDAYLATAVLIGLVLNAALGWWWADPLAAGVIVYYGIREAIAAMREAADKPELSQPLRR